MLTAFTGLVFINMSFFLAEMNALEIRKKNKALWENMVKVFAGVNEEEKDTGCEMAGESDSLFKEIDLELHAFASLPPSALMLSKPFVSSDGPSLCSPIFDIQNPPPESFA